MGGDIPHDSVIRVEERVFELFVKIAKALPDLGVHGDRLAKVEDFPVLLKGYPAEVCMSMWRFWVATCFSRF